MAAVTHITMGINWEFKNTLCKLTVLFDDYRGDHKELMARMNNQNASK